MPGPIVRFWPGPSYLNPYHALLYQDARLACDIAPGDLAAADALLPSDRPVVFHLHWLNDILAQATDAADASARTGAFLAALDRFRAKGGRFLWTMHNLVSHDCRWPEAEIALSAAMANRADAIHIHSARSLPEITALFPLPPDRLHVSPLGRFPAFAPATTLDRADARRAFGLPMADAVLLLPGLQRGYKGADLLISALRHVWPDHPDLTLVIAGLHLQQTLAALDPAPDAAERARIHIIDRFLPEDDLARLARAADAAVLPYRRVLTSASVAMVLGLGLPCIAPATGQIADFMGNPPPGWLYPPQGGPQDLGNAIRAMLAARTAGLLPALSTAAAARAKGRLWPDFTPVIHAAIR
jgi:glycosyltransferase involved in cell wall biosynthesis